MAYRQQMGAADPTDVFIPLLLTTMCSTFVGLLTVSIRQKINLLQNAFLVMFSVILALVAALFWSIYGMDKGEMETFCRVLTSVLLLGAIILFICYGWKKKINVYDSFIQGAKGGFNVAVSLIPYYLAILVAIGVFKTSGAMTMFQEGLTWCVDSLGFNTEFVSAIPVALMKPLDGGAARGMMLDCMQTYGPDSFVGHVSSVMQGSTDTTLKILAIYFGSVGIKKYRYAVGCGLLADLAGIIAAILISYFFFF
jgi:spore maturation protein SpmB